jgi:hypothetical protein
MNRQPHYPNLRLSDYFFDQDHFAGVVAGEIEIESPPGSPSRTGSERRPERGNRVRH